MNSPRLNRNVVEGTSSPALEKSLLINKNRRNLKNSILWGSINLGLLGIFLYDVAYSCPFYVGYYQYIEYTLIGLFTFNVFFHLFKILKLSVTKVEQVTINFEQKKLLGVKDSDPDYKIQPTLKRNIFNNSENCVSPLGNATNSSVSAAGLSWISNLSQNDSLNYSLSSPSWVYHKGSPATDQSSYSRIPSPNKSTPVKPSSYRDTSSIEFIRDEDSLQQFLKEHEKIESVNKLANKSQQSSNLLSSFWSHPVTKTAKDMSSFLKKCQYQLSSQSPNKNSSNSPSAKPEDPSSVSVANQPTASEVWTKINVDNNLLTQWNKNLRMWISQTVLERLVDEFNRINDSLEKHALNDIKIGFVGLDRLRKTAQMAQVVQFIPSLATLIPFLEVHPNQEYLVSRIRELTKGGCMSEFKWNGGGNYNGKEWDDSLPTDCAIIMHLFACYMDTQLMPLPNMPDTKAFSGHHYIKCTDKMPNLSPSSLFIHQISEKPPHYVVVVGERTYPMIKGYHNLFHSILFFIHHVNKLEHGMLGRVNLGRAGVNMLWIIDQ